MLSSNRISIWSYISLKRKCFWISFFCNHRFSRISCDTWNYFSFILFNTSCYHWVSFLNFESCFYWIYALLHTLFWCIVRSFRFKKTSRYFRSLCIYKRSTFWFRSFCLILTFCGCSLNFFVYKRVLMRNLNLKQSCKYTKIKI